MIQKNYGETVLVMMKFDATDQMLALLPLLLELLIPP
jgi:hypothetical protein